ncbi:hypothetical protein Lal_00042731 [Lupinus albus]|nr:hypothetical protein Lal_00042731 [Lupinus albus]
MGLDGSGSSPTRGGDGAPCRPLFFSSPSHFFATSPLFSFVSVVMATPGNSGGCDERQRRRLGKALMAMMASGRKLPNRPRSERTTHCNDSSKVYGKPLDLPAELGMHYIFVFCSF